MDAPHLRFGVVSDIHARLADDGKSLVPCLGVETFEKALKTFRDWGADAVVVAGDFTDSGLVRELESVAKVWFRVFPGDRAPGGRKVERIFVLGNHDAYGLVNGHRVFADDGEATRLLSRFPNAIAFSGHSHEPLTNERSIWRGACRRDNRRSHARHRLARNPHRAGDMAADSSRKRAAALAGAASRGLRRRHRSSDGRHLCDGWQSLPARRRRGLPLGGPGRDMGALLRRASRWHRTFQERRVLRRIWRRHRVLSRWFLHPLDAHAAGLVVLGRSDGLWISRDGGRTAEKLHGGLDYPSGSNRRAFIDRGRIFAFSSGSGVWVRTLTQD